MHQWSAMRKNYHYQNIIIKFNLFKKKDHLPERGLPNGIIDGGGSDGPFELFEDDDDSLLLGK